MDAQAKAHTRFANEIADIVEQRLIAKFAKWVAVNLIALVTTVAVGIGAYYNHEARLVNVAAHDAQIARQMDTMAVEHGAIRASLSIELREINSRLDEINRFLRDQNGHRK